MQLSQRLRLFENNPVKPSLLQVVASFTAGSEEIAATCSQRLRRIQISFHVNRFIIQKVLLFQAQEKNTCPQTPPPHVGNPPGRVTTTTTTTTMIDFIIICK